MKPSRPKPCALDRERRAVAGYSNGAVLASALGCRHPDRFGAVVAFSLGVEPPLPSGARPARHYLLAGTLEAPFHRATHTWAVKLREHGVEVEERERVCGHDLLMWEEEMPAAVRWAFGTFREASQPLATAPHHVRDLALILIAWPHRHSAVGGLNVGQQAELLAEVDRV